MAFLDGPKRRPAEFFTRGMMGRNQSALRKGLNGSLDSAPLPAPYPRELIKVKRQWRLEASNEGCNNLPIKHERQFHDELCHVTFFGESLARLRLEETMLKIPEKE